MQHKGRPALCALPPAPCPRHPPTTAWTCTQGEGGDQQWRQHIKIHMYDIHMPTRCAREDRFPFRTRAAVGSDFARGAWCAGWHAGSVMIPKTTYCRYWHAHRDDSEDVPHWDGSDVSWTRCRARLPDSGAPLSRAGPLPSCRLARRPRNVRPANTQSSDTLPPGTGGAASCMPSRKWFNWGSKEPAGRRGNGNQPSWLGRGARWLLNTTR